MFSTTNELRLDALRQEAADGSLLQASLQRFGEAFTPFVDILRGMLAAKPSERSSTEIALKRFTALRSDKAFAPGTGSIVSPVLLPFASFSLHSSRRR